MHFSKRVLISLCFSFSSGLLLATPSWQSLGGSFQGNPAGVRGYDGRLHVFVRGDDNALWFAAQTSTGGSWAPFVSLGGVIVSNPVVAIDSTGRITVFAVGSDSAVWARAQSMAGVDSYSDWTSIGGSSTSDLAVVQVIPAHGVPVAYLFMRGPDNALWFNRTNEVSGPWETSWTSLGGYLASAPRASVNVNDQATVFARGGDNALWYRQGTAEGTTTFNGWATLGGALSGTAGEISRYVTYRGSDNAAWSILDTTPFVGDSAPAPATWANPVSLGGYIISNPTMSVDGEVFVVGGDSGLWVVASPGGGPWQSLGGSVVGDPLALHNQDNTDDVFGIAPDGALRHIRQSTPSSWQ